MMFKWIPFAIFSLFLTACGSNPQSYITGKSEPIVNIDATINPYIEVDAKSDSLSVKNISQHSLQMVYKLFWYDKLGVSQSNDIEEPGKNWQSLRLNTQEKQIISLIKPTEESENYRVYVK
ncbi:periplasmic lipoprotein [Actinobacillus minor NM305]|uniref:Periplasmic lipoprotein n=1 Tax=Actinobacillus minor NM305 TaxID=637911 RepID=C5RYT7_9PAST|nr:YcfL family protein [Actinobacillus minor]EER48189.1 periplasmic lipoprotein [Actinobacillus minor NM305]MDY5106699.1 YcfL family protein [Actinobacillus minor]